MSFLRALALLAVGVPASFGAAAGCTTTVTVDDPFAGVANPGGQPLGAVCAFDEQCATGRCNGDVEAGTCGECVTIAALGEDCTGAHQGCSVSAVCSDGICRSLRKVEGEECALGAKGDDREECDVELFCARVGDFGEPGECVRRTPVGGSCADELSRCALGATCNGDKVCELPVPGSCLYGYSCVGESVCGDDGACHPGTLAQGAACGIVDGSFIDDACSPGLVCGHQDGDAPGTTCVPLPTKGEACIRERCAEGLFCFKPMVDDTQMFCDTPRGEGEACIKDGYYRVDCAAGLECRGNVCRAACQ